MRIVCSLTTIPPRIDRLKTVIDCLLRQTRLPDQIYVNVAKNYHREDLKNLKIEIPSFLLGNKLIKIVYLEKDPGPIAKLTGALQEEKDPETLIITVDDDVQYHKEMVNLFEKAAINNPDSALCTTCYNFSPELPFQRGYTATNFWFQTLFTYLKPDKNHELNFIMGFSGTAYRRKFFDLEELLQWNDSDPLFKRCDDSVISAYLNVHNIPLFAVETPENLKYSEKEFNIFRNAHALSQNGFLSVNNHMKTLQLLGRNKGAFKGKLNNFQSDVYVKLIIILVCVIIICSVGTLGIVALVKHKKSKKETIYLKA